MRLRFLAIFPLLFGGPASAQAESLFRTGKPIMSTEYDVDRRFARSQLYKLLNQGTDDPNCIQVIGGLLTVLAETGPTLHKRDENFDLDPALLQVAQRQLQNRAFPGIDYLTLMVRRVLIDDKLPEAWFNTAVKINEQYQIIDLAKLKLLADGAPRIDSFLFTLQTLRERRDLEVTRATSISTTTELEYRDRYLDRDVAWNHFMLIDVGPDHAGSTGGGLETEGGLVAHLQWIAPAVAQNKLMISSGVKPPPVIRVVAKLRAEQYMDLYRLNKGDRVMVRGRLWEMNSAVTEMKIRDAQLFLDRNWAQGTLLATPAAVAQCPAATNELIGTAAAQPGGFSHH